MHNKFSKDLSIDQREKQALVEELQLSQRGAINSVRPGVGAAVAITVRARLAYSPRRPRSRRSR